jgi:hypothetical protein
MRYGRFNKNKLSQRKGLSTHHLMWKADTMFSVVVGDSSGKKRMAIATLFLYAFMYVHKASF